MPVLAHGQRNASLLAITKAGSGAPVDDSDRHEREGEPTVADVVKWSGRVPAIVQEKTTRSSASGRLEVFAEILVDVPASLKHEGERVRLETDDSLVVVMNGEEEERTLKVAAFEEHRPPGFPFPYYRASIVKD